MKFDYIIRPPFAKWVCEYRTKYPVIAHEKSIESLRKQWRGLRCLLG